MALVDADLRSPRVAAMLAIEGGVGLTDVLLERVDLDAALQPIGADGRLSALAAGRIPPNPAELLGSPAFADLLRRIREQFEYVVIDSPPVLPVADAVALSRLVDGVVLVVGVERVRRPQFSSGLTALEQVGAPLVGVVVNRLARSGVDAYAYYAYGYYGLDSSPAKSDSATSAPRQPEPGSDAGDGGAPATRGRGERAVRRGAS